MSLSMKSFEKSRRIANRCREIKGWKGGTIAARPTNKSQQNVGELYIYAMIGASWFDEGVTAAAVQAALESLRGVETLNIYINSEGGDVFEAKAIYTQLKRFPAQKVVHIDGLAASAATFIAMAGDKIITSPAASWMVHEAWTLAMGNASDLRDSADLLEMLNLDIANIYAERTGRSQAEMLELMAAETWMSAEEALAQKFTDAVETFADVPDDAEASAAPKIAAVAATTQQRISAMTADLLSFRAKRASANSVVKEEPAVPVVPTTTTTSRASAAPRTSKPASR